MLSKLIKCVIVTVPKQYDCQEYVIAQLNGVLNSGNCMNDLKATPSYNQTGRVKNL